MTTYHDVAIIGCGPTGALLANLLGQSGLSVIVLEKQLEVYDLPRAVHFDGEVMRIFQSVGLADEILTITHVNKGMLFKDQHGETITRWPRGQKIGAMGWHESYRFHQPQLEVILRAGLKRFPNVRFKAGSAVTSFKEQSGFVSLGLTEGERVVAKFAVVCDGAQSQLRQELGINLIDMGFCERWLVIDLLLKQPRPDLGDYSVQYCDPTEPATYVRGTGNRRRWEMRLDDELTNTVSEDEVWRRLKTWITPREADLERSAIYTFRSVLAEKWRAGHLLLAGDAAHQMPPFMGQGMCAGMRDAANLAWKLRSVCKGYDSRLLDTYQSERAPNVSQFIELSVRLGKLINQTAAGDAPTGHMSSIWPALGPGLGQRDGIGGTLVPQCVSGADRADDTALNEFYVLAREPLGSGLHEVICDHEWLSARGLFAVIVRPDSYALAGIESREKLDDVLAQFENLLAN